MTNPLLGLTAIKTSALRKLLTAVHAKDIDLPLDIHGLTRHGLQYCAVELLAHLRGLDERAVRTVLVAVIAERKLHEPEEQGV
jgi:hypothetical protein